VKPRRWSFAIVLALPVAAMSVWYLSRRQSIDPAPVGDGVARAAGPGMERGTASPAPFDVDESATPVRRPVEQLPAATLVVVDPGGAPVPRAALVADVDARSGQVSSTCPGFVAWSDERGEFALDRAWIASRSTETIVISARGFLPASLDVGELGDGYERVQLHLGFTQRIQCVDVRGRPIEGAFVRLSKSPQNRFDGPPPDWRVPSPHDAIAIYEARSDASGIAVVGGLTEGRHTIRASADGYALVSGAPSASGLDVPSDAPVLTFGELVCVVCRFDGDRSLSTSVVFRAGYELGNFAQYAVDRTRNALKSRFPECIVGVGALQTPEPSTVLVRCLLEEHGVQDFDLHPVPVRDFSAPEILSPDRSRRTTLVDASVVIVDPLAGNPIIDEFFVTLDEKRTLASITVPIRPGSTVRLPRGNYTLRTHNPWLRRDLRLDAVRAPGENVAALARAYRPCRLWILEPGGGKCERALVTIESEGLRWVHGYESSEPVELWLPTGSAIVAASSPAKATARAEVTIESSATYSTQDVVIRLGVE
jgi:hypothetical protein